MDQNKLKNLLDKMEGNVSNSVRIVASNFADRLIDEKSLNISIKDHLVDMFVKGSNWQLLKQKREKDNEKEV